VSDWPSALLNPPGSIIHSFGSAALWDVIVGPSKAAFSGSNAWTTANRAIYIPFYLETTVTAYQMAVENGATLGGNLDVGIYDVLGNRLVSIGTTAQAGISVIQKFDIADTVLTPGTYFMAMSTDSTTATYIGGPSISQTGELYRTFGVREQLTAFVLPATATFANPASTTTIIPNIAIATTSVI